MGVDMFFHDIHETRTTLKSYWKNYEEKVTLPTLDELLNWAHESKIHVSIAYIGDYKMQAWKIRIWDMPPDKAYIHESPSFNDICEFLHGKLKEL